MGRDRRRDADPRRFHRLGSIASGVDAILDGIRSRSVGRRLAAGLDREPVARRRLRVLLREYRALIAPTNGQTAGFLHNKVAPLADRQYAGAVPRRLSILPATTSRTTPGAFLNAMATFRGGSGWRSLPIKSELRADAIIKHDPRFKNGGAHEAVETEALSQAVIVQIVRDRLDSFYRSRSRPSRAARRTNRADEGADPRTAGRR